MLDNIYLFIMKSYTKYSKTQKDKKRIHTKTDKLYRLQKNTVTLHLLTCNYNLTYFISIQYALIRAIPIPTPYHIKNKLTRSLTPLTHRTAAILVYRALVTLPTPDIKSHILKLCLSYQFLVGIEPV